MMKIDFDPAKSAGNERERGLLFTEVEQFDWEGATYQLDERYAYPEPRFVAVGYIRQRLHVVCFTPIDDGIRVISFRKANRREVQGYEKATNQ